MSGRDDARITRARPYQPLPVEGVEKIKAELRRLVAGDQFRVVIANHRLLLMLVTGTGLPTERQKYMTACEACEKLIHEATLNPIQNIERHINGEHATST